MMKRLEAITSILFASLSCLACFIQIWTKIAKETFSNWREKKGEEGKEERKYLLTRELSLGMEQNGAEGISNFIVKLYSPMLEKKITWPQYIFFKNLIAPDKTLVKNHTNKH